MAKGTTTVMKPSQKAAQTQVKKADQATSSAQAKESKYPNLVVKIHTKDWEALKAATGLDIYAPPLTVEDAKQLLGWESENDYVAKLKSVDANLNEDEARKVFGNDYFATDPRGQKYRLRNNLSNRPWGEGVTKGYMNDILKRYWRLNGETVIICNDARVGSGQHRLIALVYAEQTRTTPEEGEGAQAGIAQHWEDYWKEPITLECVVVYGVPNTPDITRTWDNVKSRTLSDIIYSDTNLFGEYKPVERKVVARMLDFAVKMLWARTGEKGDSWTMKRTHSESLDFVNRHPKLKECIKHIYEENKGEKGLIKKYVYPGHAAALMYLMGCSGTPDDKIDDYFALRGTATPPNEKGLKWESMKKAKMFWSDVARDAPELVNLRDARYPTQNDPVDSYTGMVFDPEDMLQGTDHMKWGSIIRAWNQYVKDEPVDRLELMYETSPADPDEAEPTRFIHRQKEYPKIAQTIDVGNAPPTPKEKKAKDTPEGTPEDGEENPDSTEELTEEQAEAKAKKSSTTELSMREAWDKDHLDYAGHVIIHRSPVSGNYVAYYNDAELIAPLTGHKALTDANGVTRCVIGPNDLEANCTKIAEAGHAILISTKEGMNKRTLAPWEPSNNVQEEASESDPKSTDENGNLPPAATPVTPTVMKKIIRKQS